MSRPPRSPKENIFAGGMAWHIVWVGLLMGIVTLGTQAWTINQGDSHWQTITFTVLCFSQLGHVMAIRSERKSIFKIGVLSNKPMLITLVITTALQLIIIYTPFFNDIFKTQPLTLTELMLTVAISSITFWAVEIEKVIKNVIAKKTKLS
jgi:Ca2+-transporting ATPase